MLILRPATLKFLPEPARTIRIVTFGQSAGDGFWEILVLNFIKSEPATLVRPSKWSVLKWLMYLI